MKKKRTKMIPVTAICKVCGEEKDWFDTIQTFRRGRLCLDCWTNNIGDKEND